MPGRPASAPRCAAIVGPYLSGKTTLFESLLQGAGAIKKKGDVRAGTAVGDRSAESQAHEMGIDLNIATINYIGDEWTFIDCPGSVEFTQETFNALKVVDAAVVVCEPETSKVINISPILHFLDEYKIPHFVFINKIESANEPLKDILEALREVSDRPLILREIPFMEEGQIAGFVDIVSERAWHYKVGGRSERVEMPANIEGVEKEARELMLEALADFDDGLLEQILEDIMPERDEVYEHIAHDVEDDLIVPVFFGSALNDNGISRLLKALRHEAPAPEKTAERLGIDFATNSARVFKTEHRAHVGKMSITRIFGGSLKAGEVTNVDGEQVRLGTIHQLMGDQRTKIDTAKPGQIVALSRVEELGTGSLIGTGQERELWTDTLAPLFGLVIKNTKKGDEVKLSEALHKICEDDPSLVLFHDADTKELVLRGQGETHIKVALERIANLNNITVATQRPAIPYRETIRSAVKQHARFKKQSGGHGQFADVDISIQPNERGLGVEFTESVVGGSVPKRFFPGVEKGVMEAVQQGPLGFPLVDVKVNLYDGQHHPVDSSEIAFKTAAVLAMKEALPQCRPVLLEPVFKLDVVIPSMFTSRVQRVVTQRRGQILNFEPRPGWRGWDMISLNMPQSEMSDLIVEVRSLTQGVGSYTAAFDHLNILSGKLADDVVAARREELMTKHR